MITNRLYSKTQFKKVIIPSILLLISAFYFISSLPGSVPGWEYNVNRNTLVYIFLNNRTEILDCRGCCKATDNDRDLMVVVSSDPSHFDNRAAIRNTWAAKLTPGISVAFILGRSSDAYYQALIEEENKKYGDIIQEDFIDTYLNLTIKSVMMLKWFLSCDSHTFLLKTDDDMLLNITRLSTIVKEANTTNTLVGKLFSGHDPISINWSKFYTPKYTFTDLYGYTKYPDYLAGAAYLMSRDVATELYYTALITPIFHIEDIFLTGICRDKSGLNITLENNEAFSLTSKINSYPGLVSYHGFSPSMLLKAWKKWFT